jgi:hypothetical protein|eukprot:SAG25_NODE_737_length_5642_cov_2.285225_9_plen_211_part_00
MLRLFLQGTEDGNALGQVAHNLLTAGRQLLIWQRCLAVGKASVVVQVQLSDGMNVTFGWIKTCSLNATAPITISHRDKSNGADKPAFVAGRPAREFASGADLPTRLTVPSGIKTTVFGLAIAKTESPNLPPAVTMERPAVTADSEIASPIITGHGTHGATISEPVDVTVQHNCHNFGIVTITLTLTFASYRSACYRYLMRSFCTALRGFW